MAKIKVMTFKETGKYYSSHTSDLKSEHLTGEYDSRLMELIKKNDPSVREYAGLVSGFAGSFYYMIDVEYEPHERGFCTFMMRGPLADGMLPANTHY